MTKTVITDNDKDKDENVEFDRRSIAETMMIKDHGCIYDMNDSEDDCDGGGDYDDGNDSEDYTGIFFFWKIKMPIVEIVPNISLVYSVRLTC